MKTPNKLLVCLALAALVVSCKNKSQQSTDMLVDVIEAQGNQAALHAEYPGQTEAQDVTDLSFKVMGTISKVYVKEGDHVKAGQVLARMDSRDYQTQLSATESEYRQIKAECERIMAMHAEHAVSDNNYDKARSGLERISAQLKHHRDQLSDCVLYAPYSGSIGQVYRTDKEMAGPSVPIVSLFTSGSCDLVINIPESEYMLRNQKATYTAKFAAIPDQSFPLTLKSVTSKANANQLYQMRFGLTEKVKDVTPGMSVTVTIQREANGETSKIVVPTGAIANVDGKTFVFVFDEKSSTVKKTAVAVENLTTDGNAVISNGLDAGTRVVASGISKLTDGQKVKALKKTSNINAGNLL